MSEVGEEDVDDVKPTAAITSEEKEENEKEQQEEEEEEEQEDKQKTKAREWLRHAVGDESADFHEGQWEAIDALVNHRQRVIVVQRTGWGKSSVYFIATRLLRELHDRGPTLIISPLLALMRNQVDAATKLGIRSATLNSTNPKEWENITQDILHNKVQLRQPYDNSPCILASF